MKLRFAKMHGLGNDFVVFDAIHQTVSLTPEQIRHISQRRFGVGCDQVLLVEAPRQDETDFYYRIFNADGTEVEQCGNGARCFARFVHDRGLSRKTQLTVGTVSGIMHLELQAHGMVNVNMGAPRLEPDQVPFQAKLRATRSPLPLNGDTISIGVVSMGNPHAVTRVVSVDDAPLERIGPLISKHPHFPRQVNAGFMEIVDRAHIRLRVYERGVGETLACGSGACAAVVVGRVQELLDEQVAVDLPGGRLVIRWSGNNHPVWMGGPTAHIYEGTIDL